MLKEQADKFVETFAKWWNITGKSLDIEETNFWDCSVFSSEFGFDTQRYIGDKIMKKFPGTFWWVSFRTPNHIKYVLR